MSISARLSEIILVAAAVLFAGGCKDSSVKPKAEIAVANSYLGAVVEDLLGDEGQVFNLVPPGMCPGHFDISPSQVSTLCGCKILFVFDFQKNIEDALPRVKERGLKVYPIAPAGGLCLPETYLGVVKTVAAILASQDRTKAEALAVRVKEIDLRLQGLTLSIRQQAASAKAGALVSAHQKEFVNWLGLNSLAVFAGRDEATAANLAGNLSTAGKEEVRYVIANKQEGTSIAGMLARNIGAELIVFSNFPSDSDRNTDLPAFDSLLTGNVYLLTGLEEQ